MHSRFHLAGLAAGTMLLPACTGSQGASPPPGFSADPVACAERAAYSQVALQADRDQPPGCARISFVASAGGEPTHLVLSSGWRLLGTPAFSDERCPRDESMAMVTGTTVVNHGSWGSFEPAGDVTGTVAFSELTGVFPGRPEWVELDVLVEPADPRQEPLHVEGRLPVPFCIP